MNDVRPVVVNSLICFLNNFRHDPNLDKLLDHFPAESHRVAYQTLFELLPQKLEAGDQPSLLDLLDRINASPRSPLFTTADLRALPLSVDFGKAVKMSKDLLSEIHQLRLIVQNAMDRKEEDIMYMPRSSQRPYPASEQDQHTSGGLSPASVSPVEDLPNRFHVDALLRKSSSQQSRKKVQEGHRLDQAVRRLTDRLGAKMFEAESRPTSTTSSHDDSGRENCSSASSQHSVKEAINLNNNNNNEQMDMSSVNCQLGPQVFHNPAFLAQLQFSQNPVAQQIMQNLARNLQHQLLKQRKTPNSEADGIRDEPMAAEPAQSSPTPSADLARDQDEAQEKPFACSQPNCKKRFANKFLLKKHQFIHTGLRPHECPFCKKQFNRKDNLLRHKKTHINNSMTPYVGRRRHNMLYGVSEETAASLNNLPLLGAMLNSRVDANDNIAIE